MAYLGPSAFRSAKRNAPRPEWKIAEAFRKWQRGRPCACGGRNPNCGGKIQSAHVDYAGGKGVASKVADALTIPLSKNCHDLQHAIGWPAFDQTYLPGPAYKLTDEYWRAWPGHREWEAAYGPKPQGRESLHAR